MSFSLLYVVTNTSIFANIKLFPCLSNLLCGSSSSFHWWFGFDDRRGVNPHTLNSHDIQEFSIQSSISHLIFSLVCRSKHFSSHQFGHTYFTLTLFFPIIDACVMNYPLQFHQIGDFSLSTTKSVGGPRWLTPGTTLALLSNNSWPFSLFSSYPLGLELLLCYPAVSASPQKKFTTRSPGCSCLCAVYILTTSPSLVLHLYDPSRIHYSFSEHNVANQITHWIMLTIVRSEQMFCSGDESGLWIE